MLTLRGVSCVRGTGAESFTVAVGELVISRGETVAITGSSGSGKSTLLEMLALVLRPTVGERFAWEAADDAGHTQDIGALWQRDAFRELARMRARNIGFVLQTGGLLPYLDVQSNIEMSRRISRRNWRRNAIPQLVEALGLSHLTRKMPHQLSVGERQRVSIARAMAHEPDLLLADEPTAALDPQLADQVITLMLELVARMETAAVIVTHDHERVRARVDHEFSAVPMTGSERGSCFGMPC
ncbi:MAG: ABC transporter ATP-binding protein [Gammaproteobacteria bacterium]|nr:ABC transporter ATP-binding protein [Gammaproteobacteria bacterium]